MPTDAQPEVESRFWSKVEPTGFCWEWLGSRSESGHGKFSISRNVRTQAHRFAYEVLVGPIPDGLQLDHLCRTPSCVNPDHLEPVTNRENVLRGYGWTAQNARKTVCANGHDLSDAYVRPNGHRTCRTCRSIWDKQRKADRKASGQPEKRRKRQRPHCVNGHPYTEESTIWRTRPSGSQWRACRTCLEGTKS